MNTWIVRLAMYLNLDENSKCRNEILATDVHSFLIGASFKVRTANNDVKYWTEKSLGFMMELSRFDKGKIYLCRGSHQCVHFGEKDKKLLLSAPKIEPLSFCLFTCFLEMAMASTLVSNI